MNKLPKMHPNTQWPESIAYKQAQQDMLVAGYRPVPSESEILYMLAKLSGGGSLNDAIALRQMLLEGDKE